MTQWALLLSALICAGCAATTGGDLTREAKSISPEGWRQLQGDLGKLPTDLGRAITLAAESRLVLSGQEALPSLEVTPGPSRQLLFDLLSHSQDRALLPDSEYAELRGIVIGEERPTQTSYAAELADYLTQPDFVCRRPLYGGYFQRRYQTEPSPSQCSTKVPFWIITRHDSASTVWLDPKRVSSIHLLFAGKSGSLASRFGHVALRLVVCPEGETTAASCDTNLFEHLVLGFKAHIDELSLNTLKALNGNYRTYLFANNFMDVYQDYAIGEFREIYSLPLRLDDSQRELLVRELADIHWSFAGSYNFFTRNCATTLHHALRASWPTFAGSDRLSGNFLRPDSLFEAIRSTPLAEGERLASLDVAEREGYYFSSTEEFYRRALVEVRDKMHAPLFNDIEGYLRIDPTKRREERSKDSQYLALLGADRHLREAQIMLEEYAVLSGERLMMIEGAKYLEQQDFLAQTDSIHSQLDAQHAKVFDDCLITPLRQQSNPFKRVEGIPGRFDIPAPTTEQISSCKSLRSKELLHEAIIGIKDAKSEQWQRLIATSNDLMESIENVISLKKTDQVVKRGGPNE